MKAAGVDDCLGRFHFEGTRQSSVDSSKVKKEPFFFKLSVD